MHKHIPSISPEEYARQVMDRAAALRALIVASPAQAVTREVQSLNGDGAASWTQACRTSP